MDILYLLREKGSTTEGISPKVTCKPLKEKTDSGKELDIKKSISACSDLDSKDMNTPSNISNIKETEHGLSNCSSSRTCTPGHYALPIIPVAPLLYEGIIDSEKQEGNVYTTPQATTQTSEAPIKKEVFSKFLPIVCVHRMLPSPILAEDNEKLQHITFHNGNLLMTEEGANHFISVFNLTSY
ncbi:Predicted gene 1527 [Apodemus speciosus]|uniref:Predicted gene 1527 n=1 Tax=Apodemus speciosus TaxID=105296 RepID=A0ABQ0FVV1_APOSI